MANFFKSAWKLLLSVATLVGAALAIDSHYSSRNPAVNSPQPTAPVEKEEKDTVVLIHVHPEPTPTAKKTSAPKRAKEAPKKVKSKPEKAAAEPLSKRQAEESKQDSYPKRIPYRRKE